MNIEKKSQNKLKILKNREKKDKINKLKKYEIK